MKKLALAPAVAIAITGLAASPVIAAPEAPASADTQPASKPVALQKASNPTQPQADGEELVLSADTISLKDFADKGLGISGSGVSPDAQFQLTVKPTSGQNVNTYEAPFQSDGNGSYETGVGGTNDDTYVGKYDVTVTNLDDDSETFSASFEVTGDESDEPEAPEVDPKVSVKDDKLTESEFEKNGVTVSGEGFTPNGKVTVYGSAGISAFGDTEVTADDEGKIPATTVKYEGDDQLEPGEYGVYAVDEEEEATAETASFTITEDETEEPTTPAAEAKLTVSPETVSPADFVKKDKGVTLAVENCEPGEDVHYVVNPKGDSNVTAYDNTVKADDEGKADVNVYGTSASDPSAYIGDYEVTVTCGDDELTGEFSVSDDANAGGSDGNEDGNGDGGNGGDNGNGGGDLPRTGTELTGLVGGAGLLLIGGVAVALTMRRKKVAQDPAEI
ncbi:LPXTG cell wall anchor domain-containing protein [Brevibacterium atlanticum]|uniref:LPXTG cell wall anchor domain-containing protein n=1 Tax=Brevibacterium atlanticum TaxID=2697563 RepID=UPI00141E1156|nr:LPXTG cell wall anchor domain-containing protein [Brevibacterium atlanticum]